MGRVSRLDSLRKERWVNADPGSILREKLERRTGLIVPGAANALTARLIADLGFEAVYLTGAGLTNMFFGLPDLGFIGLSDVAQHTAAIREAVELPIIVDADTGFGNAVNVHHTVRVLERAGANAIQLEDQLSPKRCGHFAGKDVIGLDEMLGKVRAACDARRSRNFLIIARTDARAVHGLDAAVDRASQFAKAGADLVFIEAPESREELLSLPRLVPSLHVANMVVGGKTPPTSREELAKAGFAMVIYANAALQAALAGMRQVLADLERTGALDESHPLLSSFAERQRLVDKPRFDQLEKLYAGAGADSA